MRFGEQRLIYGILAAALVVLAAVAGLYLQQAGAAVPPAGLPTAAASPAGVKSTPAPAVQPAPTATKVAGQANAQPPTVVVDYQPERPDTQAQAGTCWTNSVAVPSRLAWRCNVGSRVLDPCFALESGEVVCNPNPLSGDRGILVKLSELLPPPDLLVEKAPSPWLLQLTDGTVCSLAAGATGVVDGKRITYLCATGGQQGDARLVVLGEPTAGEVWRAEKATVALKDGKLAATGNATVALRSVVRAPANFVPLNCDRLADAVGGALGLDFHAGEAAFVDPRSGERGGGCQLGATVAAGDAGARALADLGARLAAWGWQEDMRYRAAAGGRSAVAYRKADTLCLLNLGSEGANTASQLSAACARDRSIAATQPAIADPARITFAPGGTADAVSGTLGAGQVQQYALTALAGQTMVLDLASDDPNVFFNVSGSEDQKTFVAPSANGRRWYGVLSALQDDRLTVAARGGAATFTLNVKVPVTATLPPGGGTASQAGELAANGRTYFVVAAEAGRRLELSLSAAEGKPTLSVVGLADGQAVTAPGTPVAEWSGTPARTQPYLVEVSAGSAPARYTLKATLY